MEGRIETVSVGSVNLEVMFLGMYRIRILDNRGIDFFEISEMLSELSCKIPKEFLTVGIIEVRRFVFTHIERSLFKPSVEVFGRGICQIVPIFGETSKVVRHYRSWMDHNQWPDPRNCPQKGWRPGLNQFPAWRQNRRALRGK